MIFKIEIETLLNTARKVFGIDELREKLTLITTFFDNILYPLTHKARPWQDSDILSSERYNEFLSGVERDIRLIRDSQKNVKSKILVDWNTIEQVKESPVVQETKFFDDTFTTELSKASEFVNVTLGVNSKTSFLDQLKADPQVSSFSSHPSVKPYHGKKYGVWVSNDITNEDGLRAASSDTSVLVDQKDSFYEIEVVTLEEPYPDSIYAQDVINNGIVLDVTVKLIFKAPQSINYVTVKPHTHASGSYYELTGITLSDGTSQEGVDMNPIIMTKETTVTFNSQFEAISAVYLTFKQSKGYYIKYSLANFDFLGENKWIDFTGDALMKDADKYENPTDYIEYKMRTINQWILDVWHPDMSYDEFPILNTEMGDSGFKIVESRESRRKRWAIGIEDIDVGYHIYDDKSEIVTNTIEVPNDINVIKLDAHDNERGEIYYYLSMDDGLTWRRIDPMGTEKDMENFRIVPQEIRLNSDLSADRKEGHESGSNAFINTDSKELRLRAVLIKGEDNSIPVIYSMKPVFSNHIDIIGSLATGVLTDA